MSRNDGRIYFNMYAFFSALGRGKKWSVCYVFLVMAIGLLFAFTTPKEYASSLKFVDTENVQNGGLRDIVAFAGITNSFLNSESAIFPELFPNYITSADFIRKILDKKVETRDGALRTTYKDYLLHHQKQSLLGRLIPQSSGMSPEDEDYLGRMLAQEKIKGETDIKTFAVTITVTDQDPYIAACIADSVFSLLSTELTSYRLEKKKRDLEFVKGLWSESKDAYNAASKKYSEESDKDIEAVSTAAQAKLDLLENDVQLKFNLYTMLSSQLNVMESDLHKTETTLYVFQNATVPDKPENKSKVFVMLVSMVLGVMLWTVAVFVKNRKTILSTMPDE